MKVRDLSLVLRFVAWSVVLWGTQAYGQNDANGVAKCLCKNPTATLQCQGSDSVDNYGIAQCSCDAQGYAPSLRLIAKYKTPDVKYFIASSDENMKLLDASGNALPANDVRNAIATAASRWSEVTCCTGKNAFLKLTRAMTPAEGLSVPNSDPFPANGFDGQGNYVGYPLYNRIWVQKTWGENGWTFDNEMVLASTPVVSSNGRIARSRIIINSATNPPNNKFVRWRLSNAGAGSYHFPSVMTHEFGHFVGYQHSSCSASVMVTTATQTTLKDQLHPQADVGSICAVTQGYSSDCDVTPPENQNGNPVGNGGGAADQNKVGRYGACDDDGDCKGYLRCFEKSEPGGGVCNLPCTSHASCPSTEVCNSGAENFCRVGATAPGTNGGGTAPTVDPVIPQDFCAPCNGHDDCLTGVCVKLASEQNICTAYCTSNAECGDNGTCVSSENGQGVCIPNDTSCDQSAAVARGLLNEACDLVERPCGPDLSCVQLPNTPVCLERCRSDGSEPCSTPGYFCAELDTGNKLGVCFKQSAKEGESCLLPDTSLCGTGGKMLCAGTPAADFQDAKCYKLCGGDYGNVCASTQSCVLYENSAVGVCNPVVAPPCLSGLGVKCSDSEACESGFCAIRGAEQACSRNCSVSLQSGCPSDFQCLQQAPGNDVGTCWPIGAIQQSDPRCAGTTCSAQTTGETCEQPGCGCHTQNQRAQTPSLEAIVLILFGVSPLLLRRRRRQR